MSDEQAHERLQADHESCVDDDQRCGQRAIDDRALDDEVNVPQPRTEDGDADTEGEEQKGQGREGVSCQLVEAVGRKQRSTKERDKEQQQGTDQAEDDPLGLLTLRRTGDTSIAIDLDGNWAAVRQDQLDHDQWERPGEDVQRARELEEDPLYKERTTDEPAPAGNEAAIWKGHQKKAQAEILNTCLDQTDGPYESRRHGRGGITKEYSKANKQESEGGEQADRLVERSPEEEYAHGEKDQPEDQPEDQDIRVIGSKRDLRLLEDLER